MSEQNGNGFQDNLTAKGEKFLVGYRKFIVALLWCALMAFAVVWCMVYKPSAAQASIVLWLISGAGLFTAFFAGGNALAKLWASKYHPPDSKVSLTHETEQKQIEVSYKYSAQEDAAFSKAFEGEEDELPQRKPR